MLFKNFTNKYFDFWIKVANFKEKASLIKVNFDQSWTDPIFKQRKYLVGIFLAKTVDTAFFTLIPNIIGNLLEQQNAPYFILLIMGWIGAIGISYFADYLTAIVQMQTICSIQYEAHKHFLIVDPIYHKARSSGKIIGKIDRAVDSYEEFTDILTSDFLPMIIGISTVAIRFLQIDLILALLAIILTLITGTLNTTLQVITTKSFEPQVIKAADQLNDISLENLTQIHFIRSAFASSQVKDKLKDKNNYMLNTWGTAWLAFATINFITKTIYVFTILILGLYMINLIKIGHVSPTQAISLIITYIVGSKEVLKIGRKIRKFLKNITRISDLFNYIQEFGKQTFPVFSKTKSTNQIIQLNDNYISVNAKNISFEYNKKVQIFNNHNFNLTINHSQKNKLYGVIGPSGIGKTTFISILGGQLKPDTGVVKVEGVNIYKVNDYERKKLIALQGQISSSLRGTLKSNLLFGIPLKQTKYTDIDLIEILQNVGLWSLFKEKQGLYTAVGEAGLTLSGGQRQRLNFGNLYLRANYYKPYLILIDEPTSSLDEISEKSITNMINELSRNAITLVIAHRLKTVVDACGIIDFSLVPESKDIKIYSTEELSKISQYYKGLLTGEIEI